MTAAVFKSAGKVTYKEPHPGFVWLLIRRLIHLKVLVRSQHALCAITTATHGAHVRPVYPGTGLTLAEAPLVPPVPETHSSRHLLKLHCAYTEHAKKCLQ